MFRPPPTGYHKAANAYQPTLAPPSQLVKQDSGSTIQPIVRPPENTYDKYIPEHSSDKQAKEKQPSENKPSENKVTKKNKEEIRES